MIKKFLLLALIFPQIVFAQASPESVSSEGVDLQTIQPIITSEDFIGVERKIIFDASSSIVPTDLLDQLVVYQWQFSDGSSQLGQEAVFQFNEIGNQEVILSIRSGNQVAQVTKEVFVFNRQALFIVDDKKEKEIASIADQARENGIALQILSIEGASDVGSVDDAKAQIISSHQTLIKDTDLIIFYTETLSELQSFVRYWRELNDVDKLSVSQKYFTVITDGNISVASDLVFQSFKVIQPEHILVTRPEAINPIFSIDGFSGVPDLLSARAIEHQIVDEDDQKSIFFILSRLVTSLISQGVSSSSVYLLLVIPILVFVAVFFRQVIGVSTFGVYTPVIIAAAFYFLGIGFGLLTFGFAVGTSYIVKFFVNKVDLLYLPKVGLNLSFIALSFLVALWLMVQYSTALSLSFVVFPMLVMSSLSERFVAIRSEEGLRSAVVGVAETLLVVIVSYYLITWQAFGNLIMASPEWILVALVLTLLLGKFTGLRLNEYLRFRKLFMSHTEE